LAEFGVLPDQAGEADDFGAVVGVVAHTARLRIQGLLHGVGRHGVQDPRLVRGERRASRVYSGGGVTGSWFAVSPPSTGPARDGHIRPCRHG
jgi:hypothetical protein